MSTWVTALLIMLSAISFAWCGDVPPFDPGHLTGQPGVEKTQQTDGNKIIETWTKNGVSVIRTREGRKTDVWANDNTGKGAVMCSWTIDVSIRAILETCHDPEFDALRSDLDQGIRDIDGFIAANSISPMDIRQLRDREDKQYAIARNPPRVASDRKPNFCKEGDTGKMVAYMNSMTHEKRLKSFADLLSIPRWPVLNPCL